VREPSARATIGEERLREVGVELGVPIQGKIIFPKDLGPIPDEGHAAAGIGEGVAWEDYPFPPRPQRIKDLEPPVISGHEYALLQANGARSTTIEWNGDYRVLVSSQTPGLLHLWADGQLMQTVGWWNYRTGTIGDYLRWANVRPPAGRTTVTITVVPEHMEGDWYLAIGLRLY
jgi:hypothetical protein